jgi:hypothetical protein
MPAMPTTLSGQEVAHLAKRSMQKRICDFRHRQNVCNDASHRDHHPRKAEGGEQATRVEIKKRDVDNACVSFVSRSHWTSSELQRPGA